jgi:hypothetical protein
LYCQTKKIAQILVNISLLRCSRANEQDLFIINIFF